MVVCIRENSELKKMCKKYINNTNQKNIINTNQKNIINIINKIDNLLKKLINTRKGIYSTIGSMVGSTKIELNLEEFPSPSEINKLFEFNKFFIEPYCEFLTCLFYNEDIYFKYDIKNMAAFHLYIAKIYIIVKNIINNLEENDFINLFLRLNNNSTLRLNNNNSTLSLNNNFEKLKIFYSSIKKSIKNENKKKYKNEYNILINKNNLSHSNLVKRNSYKIKIEKLNNLEKYNKILDDLISIIINICNKNKINNNINNNRKIFRLSISMFKSYNLLRTLYNNDINNKDNIIRILKSNINIIKQKYIDNLFRFQFDYISNRKIIKSYSTYYAIHDILISKIQNINKENLNNNVKLEKLEKLYLSSQNFKILYSQLGPFSYLLIGIGAPIFASIYAFGTVTAVLTSPLMFINYISRILNEKYKLTDFDKIFLEYFNEEE